MPWTDFRLILSIIISTTNSYHYYYLFFIFLPSGGKDPKG